MVIELFRLLRDGFKGGFAGGFELWVGETADEFRLSPAGGFTGNDGIRIAWGVARGGFRGSSGLLWALIRGFRG